VALDVLCGHCGMATNPADWNLAGGADCRFCGHRVEVRVFPAAHQTIAGARPEAVLGAEEASCFFHAQNRAVTHCDGCGRFLCALCDLPLDGQHLCPSCVETGVKSNQLAAADTQRTLYDSVALAFATWPLLIFYFTIITAPITFYFVIRYWKKPQGVLPRSKVRFVVAAVLAGLQIMGWIALFVTLTVAFRRGGFL